jgi:hypothetical protein
MLTQLRGYNPFLNKYKHPHNYKLIYTNKYIIPITEKLASVDILIAGNAKKKKKKKKLTYLIIPITILNIQTVNGSWSSTSYI